MSTHSRGKCHSKLPLCSISTNSFESSVLSRNSVNMINLPNDPGDGDYILYILDIH